MHRPTGEIQQSGLEGTRPSGERLPFDQFLRTLWKQRILVLYTLPGIIFFFIFSYVPMYGIVVAFQDYSIFGGVFSSPWVGLDNFDYMFSLPGFWAAFYNTFVISFMKLVIAFPTTIAFALMLNEVRQMKFKRIVQTISYLPYFISWVVAAGLWYTLLSVDQGVVNDFLVYLGVAAEPIYFMGEQLWFYLVIVFTEMWKTVGFGAIIYLAALAGINPELYEAAEMDGAGKLQKIWHISLPGIRPVIMILFILAVANLVNAGFDQMWTFLNPVVRPYADILDTYILRILTEGGLNMLAVGAAAGLFKSVLGLILFITANTMAKLLGEESIV